ncbi:MBL fold metallo-hydrolase [Chloroflexota bacterium]
MKTYSLAHDLKLIDVAPPISGFKEFISIYVLKAEKIALIDVGPSSSVDNLMSSLAELNINPTDISYVFATHIHMDHAGGIGKAIKQMPNAMVLVHEKGGPHLVEPARLEEDSRRALGDLALKYGPIEPVPQDRILVAKEGMLLNLGGMEIEVLSTPGHASHHLSFLDRKGGRLFVGEAAGVYVRGSIRPAAAPPFNLEQSLASLDKLIRLAPASLYYGHFGSTTQAVDKLSYYKQQLILWAGIIADCLGKEAGWQDMYNEIRNKDRTLDEIDSLPSDQHQRELFFIKSGIRGFAGYFQRYGTDYIKQYNK